MPLHFTAFYSICLGPTCESGISGGLLCSRLRQMRYPLLANYAYCIYRPIHRSSFSEKCINSAPIVFSFFLAFLTSPTLTMMLLRILLNTYWTPWTGLIVFVRKGSSVSSVHFNLKFNSSATLALCWPLVHFRTSSEQKLLI